MSNIHKKVDPATIKMLQEDGRDRSSGLMAPLRLEEDLDQVMVFMTGNITIDGVDVPRFGLLTLLLQKTPVYVYGHPAFKKISQTAFTDGVHVYICDDFYDKMLEDVKKNNTEFGVEWVIMHELMHKLYEHTTRLREFPPDVANIATDKSINSNLALGYPDIKVCATLREMALAFRAGDAEKYSKMSEEAIAREIMNERLEKKAKKKDPPPQQGGGQSQQGGGQGQQQGQGQGQQQGQGQGQGQPGQGSGQGQKGQGQGGQQPQQGGGGQGQEDGQGGDQGDDDMPSTQFGDENDNHMINLQEFIEFLEEQGLDDIKKGLNLPDSKDADAIGEFMENEQIRQEEAVQEAENAMNRVGGKYPGAHIASHAASYIRAKREGKMSWKQAARDLIFGSGPRYLPSMEEASDLRYIPGIENILGFEPYLPVELPFKNENVVVVVVDTSGSVSDQDLEDFTAEILQLKTASSGEGEAAAEVIIVSADTVVRGDPQEINEENIQEILDRGVNFLGRGGTDLEGAMCMVLQSKLVKEKNIVSFVYMTDLFDGVPRLEALEAAGLPENAKVAYIVAPSTSKDAPGQIEHFKREATYADIYEIKSGVEVDLDDTTRMEAAREAGKRRKAKV